jgi:nitrite reductase/ring-hydroxylating ferredoxin subunit
MAEYVPVCPTAELGPGEVREVEAHGEKLALLNIGQTYYALSAACPNDGTNLAREGRLDGDALVCPNDGWAFDVRTGERVRPRGGPALRRRAIAVKDNQVLIGPRLPEAFRGAA